MVTHATPKVSFRSQMLLARERAIIQTVNRLLAEKGFEAMTVDQVAEGVGIAKASLYKHFASKEDLAAAAMADLMVQAQTFLDGLAPALSAIDKLRTTVEWTMRLKLDGNMPTLPSQNSSLRAALMVHKAYMDGLMDVSDRLGAWIEEAQQQGALNPQIPAIAVLYTLYARACDPVLEFLKASDLFSDDQIIEMVLMTCFDGLRQR
ncbi:MAG: helix-turn-helix domain-containing protein [Rhodoferax sp.]|nr:helix-turn-helix domain-containing protein [Rhodoferax sp.]